MVEPVLLTRAVFDVRVREVRSAEWQLFTNGEAVPRWLLSVAMVGEVPLVALEVGWRQAGAVAELMRSAGFGSVSCRRDLAGHERVVVGVR